MNANGVIRFLRSGIVPVQQVRRLSVGYSKLDSEIVRRLKAFREGERTEPIFVQGEWGTGKSHFLAYVQSAALHDLIPVIELPLNARTTALNHPQRMYAQMMTGLRHRDDLGLREILMRMASEAKVRSDMARSIAKSESALSTAIQIICGQFATSAQHVSGISASSAWNTILGSDIAWADYPYKKEEAIARLEELAGVFRKVGAHGVVVLLDELETIDQLWNVRSRLGAYAVLGRLCRSANIFSVFAITGRFNRVIDSDIDRGVSGWQSIPAAAKWFLLGWKRGDWPKFVPPEFTNDSARGVVQTINDVYTETYNSSSLSGNQFARCVADWGKNPGRNPRQLIRLTVDALDRLRPLQSGPSCGLFN